MTFEGCFTIKLSAKIVVFYKNDTCRRIFYPIAAGPRTLPDGNPCKSRAPQGGIRQNPARIPQVCDRSPKSSANENGINGQPAMFHRKQSAGTRQKDKFRHRKAIRRIVSRPRNLKFPGGHDAFTNYFRNSGKLLFVPYTKDFGRITQFWGNDLATVLYATFCSDMLSSHSFSKQR